MQVDSDIDILVVINGADYFEMVKRTSEIVSKLSWV
jgi:predicted nucleotidyltransferase